METTRLTGFDVVGRSSVEDLAVDELSELSMFAVVAAISVLSVVSMFAFVGGGVVFVIIHCEIVGREGLQESEEVR